jgi:hypothetical protein
VSALDAFEQQRVNVDWKYVAACVAISSLGAYCLARSASPPPIAAVSAADGGNDTATTPRAPASASASAALPAAPDDLWARAASGAPEDLARLAQAEGSEGLVAGATSAERRMIAIKALAHVDGFGALPFLSEIAASGKDDEARAALESIADAAARPRRALDPDDALELRRGCDTLLALARDASVPRARRTRAVSALRMLADRGCVEPKSIPKDLDAK